MVAPPSLEASFQIEWDFAGSRAGMERYAMHLEQLRVEIGAFWVAHGCPDLSAENISVTPGVPDANGMVTVRVVFTLP